MNSSTHELVSRTRSNTTSATSRPVALAACGLALVVLSAWLCRAWLRTLTFDDAYMFYRYALNIRHGLGISWNPDGAHTYGMTSLPWVFVVLPLTLLPLAAGHALQLASWLVGVLAIAVMAGFVARHARSKWLQSPAVACAVIALPLGLNPVFAFHLTTGMDTVLSLLANAILVGALVRYLDEPGLERALGVGVLVFGAVLVRPDNGMAALGSACLGWLTLGATRKWRDLLGLCVLPLGLIAVELLVCKAYFGIPLPLGFYAKSLHSYAGFQNGENAVAYMYMAASVALPFLGALGATLTREQLPRVVALLLPVVLTAGYLFTVRQVMGFGGRYYLPFIPYAVIPALLSVDAALAAGGVARGLARPMRRIAIGIGVAIAAFVAMRPIEFIGETRYHAWVIPPPVPVPALPGVPTDPLPDFDWFRQPGISQIVAGLPPRAVVAASEVGYLGAVAPQVTLIDLVGLNDTDIGTRGFSMTDFLTRAPDLIWLPQEHYTGLLATMLGDPRLLERYVVIAHAYDFGIAIRCDSPVRAQIERGVRETWPAAYPSQRLADYTIARCAG